MDPDYPDKRVFELLRKRCRLPISLLVHSIDPDDLYAWKEYDGKIIGLVQSYEDAKDLLSRSHSIGATKIRLRCAEYLSLQCMQRINDHISAASSSTQTISVRILNPTVAKEKLRAFSVLDNYCSMLREAIDEMDKGNWCKLVLLRSDLREEREKSYSRTQSLQQKKTEVLDQLLFLLLDGGASNDDLAQGIWILEHHRQADHGLAVNPDGTISESGIDDIRQRIKERLGDKILANDKLDEIRGFLLGLGRFHMESKVQEVFNSTDNAIGEYILDNNHAMQSIAAITSQLEILGKLIKKRSLIGSFAVNLPGDEIDSEYDSDPDVEESSENSNVDVESSLSENSIKSTDSELPFSYALEMQKSEEEEERKAAAALAATNAAPVAIASATTTAAPASDATTAVPGATTSAAIATATDKVHDVTEDEYGEPAYLTFPEIEGESEEERTKRFNHFVAGLDYCLS